MNDKYFSSEDDAVKAETLLTKILSTFRQAHSDRTAWVMSELAYIKFNLLFPKNGSTDLIKGSFIKKVSALVGENKSKNSFNVNW